MTIDELAAKMDEGFDRLEQRFGGVEQRVGGLEQRVGGLEQRVGGLEQRFEGLEQKMDRGFNESKIRDERLEGLITFGLEAREVLRDEMHRRFDAADRKNDEQIMLLKDAVQHLNTRT